MKNGLRTFLELHSLTRALLGLHSLVALVFAVSMRNSRSGDHYTYWHLAVGLLQGRRYSFWHGLEPCPLGARLAPLPTMVPFP